MTDTNSQSPILNIENLKKSYGDIHALKGVSLSISKGEILGLLGPNGAGKSTLINILAGLTIRDSGIVDVDSYDVTKDYIQTRERLGIVHQEIISDGFFDVETILKYQSGYYGIADNTEKIANIIEKLGLTEYKNRKVQQLSGGMKRRLLIAKALVHNPILLVLDEPTAGVDVELRQSLWKYVRELNANGTTVLLTTHYIEEAEELCDRIGIINHGQMVTIDETRKLIDKLGNRKLEIRLKTRVEELPGKLTRMSPEKFENGKRWKLSIKKDCCSIREILQVMEENSIEYQDLSTEEGDLEDVFINFTKK